jgi:hypothetical protein
VCEKVRSEIVEITVYSYLQYVQITGANEEGKMHE